MAHTHGSFVPAAGHDWLLPLYDPLNRLLGAERVKSPLVEQAGIRAGQRVLDIGCGTGAMTLIAKRRNPEAQVMGLDPDPRALARARRKARGEGLEIRFDQGFSQDLPYPDESFDHVLSSLMFHHLDGDAKAMTLGELWRVLVDGGALHVLDFGPPRSRLTRFLSRIAHHGDALREDLGGAIPERMTAAGFEQAREVDFRNTWVGSLSYYRGFKPR